MEASVEAPEVLATSSVDANNADGEVAAPAPPPAASDSSSSDPMEEFSRRLEDIISTYGSAADALDKQVEAEKTRKEANDGIAASMEAEVSVVMQSLNQLSSPEDKLGHLLRKYAELVVSRRSDERTLCVLQDETRSSIAARSKLEILCRELQGHYSLLREETLRHCREDEEKRTEMVGHFQTKLAEIQAQIEQHSARNDKLCRENTNLTDKLESLMNQCELREESLEKIDQRRDLQQKLTEAKLQQANALLSEAEDKHKREKEYLLREAIDKTKKCFAMKEQELAMKKKLLVQAAEWKLQAQTLREQAAVMQAQLTLYGQKFDDFQATLAKSNQIYARFKKEMDNMSEKMKKMEKESNLWKARFENCNKALTDMIEERTEKGKEYDLFVLKIQKLEKLCRALQDERIVLYDKIKEVRHANSSLPSKVFGSSKLDDIASTEGSDKSSLETPPTPLELQEMEEDDPVLTENMSRLTEEQAKLQEFAASLLATPSDDEEEDKHEIDLEEDTVASAFVQFKTKTPVKKEAVSVPEQVVEVTSQTSESGLPQPDKSEEVEPAMAPPEPPTPVESTSETEAKTETVEVQAQAEDKEVQPEPDVKPDEEIQQQTAESIPTSEPQKVEINPPTDLKPEAAEAEVLIKAGEVKPVIPVEEKKVQAEPVQEPEEAPTNSTESTLPTENSPKMTASSSSNCSKKQTPKKKKKKNTKSAS